MDKARFFSPGLLTLICRLSNGNLAEDWDKFPSSRERLLNTILNSGAAVPILVSGDVHMAQMMRVDCKKDSEDSGVRSIVEVTTSGLTHSWGTGFSPYPKHRNKWYSPIPIAMSRSLMHFAHKTMPWAEMLTNDNSYDVHNEEDGLLPLGSLEGRQYVAERASRENENKE